MNLPYYAPYPALGFGLGLRNDHIGYVLKNKPTVDWFEILAENYMIPNTTSLRSLMQIREYYPLVIHGVSLSIGSTDPLNDNYLLRLKNLIHHLEPQWISDHLCWTGIDHFNTHDLLPLPYTEETIQHVVSRIQKVQDLLNRQILIENVSSYVAFKESSMTEWDFLTTIAEQADCLILLDINNIYVSSYNHGFDPYTYINAMPKHRVQQFHLAGHTSMKTHIIDTHDAFIIPSVWALYKQALKRFGSVSTMIERDANIPPFPELQKELDIAKNIAHEVAMQTVLSLA